MKSTGNAEAVNPARPLYNLILHLHPRRINKQTLRFNLTFGLGGMAALLVVLQIFTGLLLKFHYEPTPLNAYNSILNLEQGLLFGQLARNIHHWGAVLLLWITFLHMLRVFFTGAYCKPRHATWIFGIALLILVILSNFTGYLLPWDQISYWAVTISTSLLEYIPLIGSSLKESLLGAKEVGGTTLTNFYNLHTGVVPVILVLLMGYHFWRIRKAGGVIVSEADKESHMVDTQPNLVAREFVAALGIIAVLLLLSALFDAPLHERANPSISPNPAKAPWYFMGLQELLIHFHPFFAIVVFPVTLLLAACWLPFIKLSDNNQGIWFLSEKGRKSGIYAAVAGFFLTILFILVSDLMPDPEMLLPSIPSLITTGFIPFAIVVCGIWFFIRFLRNNFSLNLSECIQSVCIILIVSYTVLSLTGILFRGEGMKLIWPWQL